METTIITKPCFVCGKLMLVKKGKFCSDSCREIHQSKRSVIAADKNTKREYNRRYRARVRDRKRYEELKRLGL